MVQVLCRYCDPQRAGGWSQFATLTFLLTPWFMMVFMTGHINVARTPKRWSKNMSNSQFSLFLELLLEHFWLGELVDSSQFCGGWLYLCLCIHRNNALFFVFVFKCMFASFVVTWVTHKVAFACCVTSGRKIPHQKCACVCWWFACIWVLFWVEFCKGLGQILSSRASLTREGPNRWSERPIAR